MITSYFASKKESKTNTKSCPNSHSEDVAVNEKRKSVGSNSSCKRVKTDGAVNVASQRSPDNDVSGLLGALNEHTLSHTKADNNKKSWRGTLGRHLESPSFAKLARFVAQERKSGKTIYPPPEDVFSALNLTPFPDVKLVIVGQDPYFGPRQAHGLCFSVRKGVQIPPSLRNIYKELADDPNVEFSNNMPLHGYLERWARQGVLMLNSVLTVRGGQANSHKSHGWEEFTDEIIRVLDRDRCKNGMGLVFLLWGKPAASKVQTALSARGREQHKIICSSHPSPLAARKTNAPFLGSRCFSRANTFLKEMGHSPIDWNVDAGL